MATTVRPESAEWWQTDEYLDVVYAVDPEDGARHIGVTEPRIGSLPLRPLDSSTSLGFEAVAFASEMLNVQLYPWERAALIRGLEINPDGTYRFRRVLISVARQNGKTLLASVLAAWWLFVESARRKDRVPPFKFKIVGIAQNLDIAKEPWNTVKMWADPDPETEEDQELALPWLQEATTKVVDTNGALAIIARSRAHYEIRAGKNARGKPAARVLMDEMREQKDWSVWNAVAHTTKSFWNGMLVGFSNAGDSSAVVLKQQRKDAIAADEELRAYIEEGIGRLEEFANTHDVTLGILEWSAPDGCDLDDVDAILAANPTIGYGAMTVQTVLSDIRTPDYRTESLNQWVTVRVKSHIDPREYDARCVPAAQVRPVHGARTVWGVDVFNGMSWVTSAVATESGKTFLTARIARAGTLWVPEYLKDLAERSGFYEVALQASIGVPSAELAEPLEKLTLAGGKKLIVHRLGGGEVAAATTMIGQRIRDRQVVFVKQPGIRLAFEGGAAREYNESHIWSRNRSKPVDIAGLVAMSEALYVHEAVDPPKNKPAPSTPPRAAVIEAESNARSNDVNLVDVAF
ncbi:terminase [Microbacterium luteum]|uniref:terminase n=1 Tax=Microbacterium luteum TaxID=2782167 RepID=UPI0018896112|nr:terminase [Microbacterium luteum]